jgi:prepilin-type N-terminal cleavage/methylation domain-containing protein/prepilin-type processing-associated H-X9-DG protein
MGREPAEVLRKPSSGFSLVEMLVVIAILAVLIGILVPIVSSTRRNARNVACASNMRQIALGLIAYASQNKGSYPPNSAESGQFWYLEALIGQHITAPDKVGRAGAVPAGADASVGLAGGVFVCPDDREDSVRSYSMNIYASGGVSSGVQKKLDSDKPPGRLFKHGAGGDSARLMLVLETWPELPVSGTSPLKHVAQAVAGLVGRSGERFGGGKGIVWTDPPDATPGRFEVRASQITFYRHGREHHAIEEPRGQANFAFADGHVEMLNQKQLVQADGRSSYAALWCPIDRDVDAAQAH